MLKKMISLTLTMLLLLGTVLTGAATAAGLSDGFWQTDIRMSITREDQLMRDVGKDLNTWDGEIAGRVRQALQDPLTMSILRRTDAKTEIMEENGRVYYIGPSRAFPMVYDAADAYALVYRLVSMLGGSEKTDLRLWSRLTKDGNTVYSFQEIADSETVPGSTVKIALDENGKVTAVFANIMPPDYEKRKESAPSVSRMEAERAVLEYANGEKLLPEYTERIIREPVWLADLDLESSDDDAVPHQLLWVVYTTNSGEDFETYPYLAHYLKLDGTWLFKLAVKQPGDEEARSGFRRPDVFAGMTAGEYTGEITDIYGNAHTVTVPVMKSEKTQRWYLGDVNRRIAVADFYEAVYQDSHPLLLVSRLTNSGWDNEDLYMYYNYIRAWDFYAEMGWIGPDGQGTDVIILKGLAYRSHDPYENACSIGLVEGWQMFGYTPIGANDEPLGLVKGLDVMAHEYTHTFTSAVMNENMYENDLGAINEAMSDIMGNLVEFIYNDTEDTAWTLGENTGMPIRSMTDPNSMSQPAYVWDIYYGPHSDAPGTANDRGGVHYNSSLLNRICALLCRDYGMSYEEAVSFWLTVAMGMTPEADYTQMHALLKWAAKASGNEAYLDALNTLIAEERLDTTARPTGFPEGQRMAILRLPDNETFADENWAMLVFQVNTQTLVDVGAALVTLIMQSRGDPSVWQNSMEELMKHVSMKDNKLSVDDAPTDDAFVQAVLNLLRGKDLYSQLMSWPETDTREIPLVENENQLTVYLLMNITGGGSTISGITALIGGRWIDIANVSQAGMFQMSQVAKNLLQNTGDKQEGKIVYLPTEGLDEVRLLETAFPLSAVA